MKLLQFNSRPAKLGAAFGAVGAVTRNFLWAGFAVLLSAGFAVLLSAGVAVFLSAGVAVFLSAGFAFPPAAQSQELDEPPQPLARAPRSEAEQDRLDAISYFSAARLAEQRQQLAQALRGYQRAFRYDSKSVAALREIIPLAFSQSREEEAVRYATKLAELDAGDPMLLRRLGVVLTEQGDWKQALSLYEKAVSLETKPEKNSAGVMLRLEMGRLYFLTEQFDKSAAMFDFVAQALEKPSEYNISAAVLKTAAGEKGEVHELMATAFLEANRPDDAAAAFARQHKIALNDAVQAYHEARVAAKKDQPQAALDKLQAYFDARESSKSVAPYELLAKLLAAIKKSDELIPRLEKLLQEQAGNAPLNFALAEEYRKQRQFAKAAPLYQTALSKQPTSLGYRRLVETYREMNEHGKLLDLLGEVVTKSGSLEIVSQPVKEIAAHKQADAKQAVDKLIEAAQEKHKAAPAESHAQLRAAALVAVEAKRFDAAGELFNLAIESKPAEKAEILLIWGLQLFLNEKFADAKRVFQRGIDEKALPESNPAFYFYLAGALAMNDEIDAALAAARTAIEKKPGDARFESRLAWIYYHAKQYDEAAKHYQQLIEKYDSTNSSADVRDVMHDTRLILSNIAVLQNKLPEAEEWIEQVLDEFPDDIGAQNDLGYLWADQNKRLLRAERMIRAAVTEEPKNAAYRDSLGWVLYRLGRYPEALQEQQQAIELRDKTEKDADGVMYEHLGDIHAKLNQPEHAVAAWHTAATAFEKTGEKEKLAQIKKKIDGK